MCFGQHGKSNFKNLLPIIEKFKPDVIAPEGVDYTKSLRNRSADAFRMIRGRINQQAETPLPRNRINRLLGPFPLRDPPFAEYEYREALARGIAYFPIEVHKQTRQFMGAHDEFIREQFRISILLSNCPSWNSVSKGRLEKTAQNFLLASKKYAISNIERENDIIQSIGSYQSDLIGSYPELSNNKKIRVFAHFGTYHVGIHYFGKRHYLGNGDIQLSSSMASLDCSGNLCSLFMRFGKLPPAGILYHDLISLSQISKQAYYFLQKNEESIIKALKPLVCDLKPILLP